MFHNLRARNIRIAIVISRFILKKWPWFFYKIIANIFRCIAIDLYVKHPFTWIKTFRDVRYRLLTMCVLWRTTLALFYFSKCYTRGIKPKRRTRTESGRKSPYTVIEWLTHWTRSRPASWEHGLFTNCHIIASICCLPVLNMPWIYHWKCLNSYIINCWVSYPVACMVAIWEHSLVTWEMIAVIYISKHITYKPASFSRENRKVWIR